MSVSRVWPWLLAIAMVALGYGLARLSPVPASGVAGGATALPPSGRADRAAPGTVASGGADPVSADTVHFDPGAAQLASIRVEAATMAPVPLGEPLHARLAYNENLTARVHTPIAGRITGLSLQVGDRVRTGQALLTLDAPELAAAVADARKARADDERRRLALERAQRLVEVGVLPRRELEAAQAEADMARAEAQRAERRLRNLAAADADSATYTLRSPLEGVVAERRVNPGMEVRPDTQDPLFVVTETSRLWVLIDLPERELSLVRPGQRALVRADAWPAERFMATIERVGERVDPTTRRVEVRAVVENFARRLKPEMYVQVTLLPDQGRQAVRLPNSALVTQGLYSYVFVEGPPGFFRRRKVTLGVQDRTHAFVTEGVEPGESVVTTGALLLNSELATLVK
jgi:cobalt-zinc-cadmium efflux system membrane fusion protein